MKAYKFLARGAVGPFSGFSWPKPAPGQHAWLEADAPLVTCSRGLHVCRVEDLAYWIHEELWELEVAGETESGVDCLVARKARLVRPIAAWADGGATRFLEACQDHARALAGPASAAKVRDFLRDAGDCAGEGYVALSAFCAALAVTELAPAADRERCFRSERAWQGAWIGRELIDR